MKKSQRVVCCDIVYDTLARHVQDTEYLVWECSVGF